MIYTFSLLTYLAARSFLASCSLAPGGRKKKKKGKKALFYPKKSDTFLVHEYSKMSMITL